MRQCEDNNALLHAYNEIRKLEEGHAEHIKGWKCGHFPREDILKYAILEINELQESPDDIDEMADSLICLLSYCVQNNWDLSQISKAIRKKLRLRFKDADKLIGDINDL